MLKISDLNLATLNNVQYTLAPFTPGKEWLVLVKGQQVGIIRANGDRFGWCDRDGGHWFATKQEAIDALVRIEGEYLIGDRFSRSYRVLLRDCKPSPSKGLWAVSKSQVQDS